MNLVAEQNPRLYRLVVSHYVASAICLLVMAFMLLPAARHLTGHYFHPQLLAITHMAALGWGTLVIFGALYQLLPVILDTELYSYKVGWLSMALFVAGLFFLVYSFWYFLPGLHMQCGSVLLLSAIVLFTVNVFRTAKRSRNDIHQEFIITACIWLVATAALGTILVFNFRYAFLQKDHILFLKLHAHMGLAGWFLMLITGISSKLIPMFLVSQWQKHRLLSWSYYLINAGLMLFVVDTYFSGLNMKTFLAALVVLIGVLCWFIFILGCFLTRVRKAIDIPIWHSILSFLFLGAALLLVPFIILYHLKADQRAIQYTTLYGSLLFMGWLSSLILGQSFKTLPFIVWLKHYQNMAGKRSVPLPADIYSRGVLKLQFAAYLIFIPMFYCGMFFRSLPVIYFGLGCFIIVSAMYLYNILIIIFHKPKPSP